MINSMYDFYIVRIQYGDDQKLVIAKSKKYEEDSDLVDVNTKEVINPSRIISKEKFLGNISFLTEYDMTNNYGDYRYKRTHNKELLSYESYSVKNRHFNGIPIVEFTFKNVRDESKVRLFQGTETVRLDDGTYIYENILEATNDFDILWRIETNEHGNEILKPPADSYHFVESEFYRLLSDGVNDSEINEAMMNSFKVDKFIKVLKP